MNSILKIVLLVSFNFILAYLIIAFVWWEYNFENWGMAVRGFYVLLVVAFNVISVAILEIGKHY